MDYKFNGSRVMTSGINERVPFNIQLALWDLVDKLVKSEMEVDYLQVFELKTNENLKDNKILHIKHSQEVPEYKKEYVLEKVDVVLNDKIYIIDDVEHCTMLFASEY